MRIFVAHNGTENRISNKIVCEKVYGVCGWTSLSSERFEYMRDYIVALAVLFSICQAHAETSPVNINISDVKTLANDAWGESAKDGDHSFRTALKGKAAWLRVTPWWSDG